MWPSKVRCVSPARCAPGGPQRPCRSRPLVPALERGDAHAKVGRSLVLCDLAPLMAVEPTRKTHPTNTVVIPRRAHPMLPGSGHPRTRHLTSYKHTTDNALPTGEDLRALHEHPPIALAAGSAKRCRQRHGDCRSGHSRPAAAGRRRIGLLPSGQCVEDHVGAGDVGGKIAVRSGVKVRRRLTFWSPSEEPLDIGNWTAAPLVPL